MVRNPSFTRLDARFASFEIIGLLGIVWIPIGLSFVALRYRLWDIDLVINRTLVFAGVTAVLVTAFAAMLLILQIGLRAVLGAEQTALAATVSTGVVVVLFNPVRKRVRRFIDRRVYGLRYDLYEVRAAQKLPPIKQVGGLSGQKVGEFDVRDLIGRGGMGEVYLADTNGLAVALKIVPAELANNPELRQRLEREAQALQALRHPNIVRFYSTGESNGIYYIALEYIAGQDLNAHLEAQGWFEWSDVHTWASEITSALEHMHQHNLVHRDIKPANIMLRAKLNQKQEEAILMDFGIAKLQHAGTRLTTTGNPIGSIGYMAPEQILDAKEVDHRADIYALAVLLYELLTGESPFKGSVGQLLFAHLQ